jgi:hypothetical protein
MFKEVPATQGSLNRRRLIQGHGINDAPYNVHYRAPDGISYRCDYYTVWICILTRCYSARIHGQLPSYKGCTMDTDWHRFMTFRAWLEQQDWRGKAINRTILDPDNKHYGPDTCIFVDPKLNTVLNTNERVRGPYPLGVLRVVVNGKAYFSARCSFYGKQTYLGHYPSAEEAHQAYTKAKHKYLRELGYASTDPRVKQALLARY